MSEQLVKHVYVADRNGQPRLFSPGDRVPKWARALITNPKAWAEVEDEDTGTESAEDDESGEDGDESTESSGDDETQGETVPVPPQNGPGSGTDEWRKYAESKGFELDEDVKRDEIIAALKANDVPTE